MSLRKSVAGRTSLFMQNGDTLVRNVRSSGALGRQDVGCAFHVLQRVEDGVCCWHCCEPLADASAPFRIPKAYDPRECVYHVYGIFCQAACAKAHIIESTGFDRAQQLSTFASMMRDVYNVHDTVLEAPPRFALRKFGGPLSIDDFQRNDRHCSIVEPPFVTYCMLLREGMPGGDGEVHASVPPPDAPTLERLDGLSTLMREEATEEEFTDVIEGPPHASAFETFLREKRAATDAGADGDGGPRPPPAAHQSADGARAPLRHSVGNRSRRHRVPTRRAPRRPRLADCTSSSLVQRDGDRAARRRRVVTVAVAVGAVGAQSERHAARHKFLLAPVGTAARLPEHRLQILHGALAQVGVRCRLGRAVARVGVDEDVRTRVRAPLGVRLRARLGVRFRARLGARLCARFYLRTLRRDRGVVGVLRRRDGCGGRRRHDTILGHRVSMARRLRLHVVALRAPRWTRQACATGMWETRTLSCFFCLGGRSQEVAEDRGVAEDGTGKKK
jgi:hypothetical protein